MKHAPRSRRYLPYLILSALLCLASFPVRLFASSSFLFEETGLLATERAYHTATLLPDGRVLAAGGNTGLAPTATAEIFDPATGAWTPTGSMNEARYRYTATLLQNGLVLVVGGLDNNDNSLDLQRNCMIQRPESGQQPERLLWAQRHIRRLCWPMAACSSLEVAT